jgi:hypothetical protein
MKIYTGEIEYTMVLKFTVNAENEKEAFNIAKNNSSFKPEFITNKEITKSGEMENYNLGFISAITTK